ncbi:MAG: RNA-binding protein [Desulfurococcaceae archaeon]|nr:RNA-binding protein [Desulfurococcaceae archaeon]MCC6053634.1 RNA-binding protein [Desulfurococcaceae archaeon]
MSETAHKILEENLGNSVLIKTKEGVMIRGKLKSFDQHLNVVLEEAEELMRDGSTRKLGVVIIRGDTIILVSPTSTS